MHIGVVVPTPLLLTATCLVFLLGLLALGVHGPEGERRWLLRRFMGFALLGVTIFGFARLRGRLDDETPGLRWVDRSSWT